LVKIWAFLVESGADEKEAVCAVIGVVYYCE
jgi:hypothetical protein